MLLFDRYYTPENVASGVLRQVEWKEPPQTCADSTCGSGRLLDAASSTFRDIRCIGIDRDKRVIAALRQRRPNWTLATSNLLSTRSFEKTAAKLVPAQVDLLFMNPPFSHGNRKHVKVCFDGQDLVGSIAMAYILRSFQVFKPTQGALLIVPESLLYSRTDEAARNALSRKYELRKIADLESSTFNGARAHACVIHAYPGAAASSISDPCVADVELTVRLSRGCLPVHLMTPVGRGVPFLHSTDLRRVARGENVRKLPRSSVKGSRVVQGWTVLVPRVGVPDISLLRACLLDTPVRLSDCVIAIECDDQATATKVERRVQAGDSGFKDLYKGTGARYVTMDRLKSWLVASGIAVKSD
jgi:predicted RNA methylase